MITLSQKCINLHNAAIKKNTTEVFISFNVRQKIQNKTKNWKFHEYKIERTFNMKIKEIDPKKRHTYHFMK